LSLVIVSNFLIGASIKGVGGFRLVALGTFALLVGQYILVHEWRPEFILVSGLLLFGGSRLFISRLHSHYLWQ